MHVALNPVRLCNKLKLTVTMVYTKGDWHLDHQIHLNYGICFLF